MCVVCRAFRPAARQPRAARRRSLGFSLVELLVVMAIISLLASMMLPSMSRAKEAARRIVCVNNLHNNSPGLRMWADDNNSRYPWQVSSEAGGSKGNCGAWAHLAAVADQIFTPKVLVCPSDDREASANFTTNRPAGFRWNRNYSVSYFIGLDATEMRPQMHLLGDRNIVGLESQRCPPTDVGPVATWLEPTNSPAWTIELHRWRGNMALADGSVTMLGQAGLRLHCVAAAMDSHANCALRPDYTDT
jgi:prepilin-type N-terminal cleavage/methylation domain-containing protein